MINSIQHFTQDGVKKLTDVFDRYTDDLSKIAEMVQSVTDEVVRLGTSIIAEEWESYDELLRKKRDLRLGWHIVRKDTVTRTRQQVSETLPISEHCSNTLQQNIH